MQIYFPGRSTFGSGCVYIISKDGTHFRSYFVLLKKKDRICFVGYKGVNPMFLAHQKYQKDLPNPPPPFLSETSKCFRQCLWLLPKGLQIPHSSSLRVCILMLSISFYLNLRLTCSNKSKFNLGSRNDSGHVIPSCRALRLVLIMCCQLNNF